MKYHNNLKTIFITFFVVLMFLSVSVFLLVRLNLTSPTMIITDTLMKRISEADSDFSLEVENVERNFRDRVMLNNLSLYYRGEEFASFSTVEVKLGIFDAISYLLNLGGSAEIRFSDGSVTLISSLFEKSGSGGEAKDLSEVDDTISSFLSSHNMTLSFENTDLSTPYGSGNIDELYLSYLGSEKSIIGEMKSDSLSLSYSGYDVTVTSPVVNFQYGNSVFLSSSFSSVSVKGSGIDMGAEDISLSVSAPTLSDALDLSFIGKLEIASADGVYGSNDVSLSSISLVAGEKRELVLSLKEAELSSDAASLSLSSLEGNLLDYETYSLKIESTEGSVLSVPVTLSSFSLDGKISEKKLSFVLSEAKTEAGKYTDGNISGVRVTALEGDVDYSDGLKLGFDLDMTGETPSERIDDISFSLSSSISIVDGKITDSSAEIRDLWLGYGEKYNSLLSISGDLDEALISLDYGAFDIDLTLSLNRRTVKGDISVNSLSLPSVVPLFSDSDISLFNSDSSLSFSSSFDLEYSGEENALLGSLSYSLSVPSLSLPFMETKLSSTGALTFTDGRIILDDVSLSSSFFDLTATGSFDLVEKLPDLDFRATLPGGKEFLKGYMHLEEKGLYVFYADFSSVTSTYLSGSVDFSRENYVTSSSILETRGKERPFALSVDMMNKTVSVHSDSLSIDIDYSDGIRGSILSSSLETLRREEGGSLVLDGKIDFSYSLSEGLALSSSVITISDIFFLPQSPSVTFVIKGEGGDIRLDDINVAFTDGPLFSGSLALSLANDTVQFALSEKGGEGSIIFSLYKDDDFTAVFKADDINLSVLGRADMYAYVNLYGRAKRIQDFSFTGTLDVTNPSDEEEMISCDLTIDGSSLSIYNVVYLADGVRGELENLYFRTTEGSFGIEGLSLRLENRKADRSYPVSASVSLEGEMEKGDSLYSTLLSLIRKKGSGVKFTLNLLNIDLDSSLFVISDRYATVTVGDDEINIEGNFLNGTMTRGDRNGEISISLENIVEGVFTFDLSPELLVKADISAFNMSLVNLLMKYPTLVFRDDIVHGKASLTGDGSTFSLNGSLGADELGVDVFWVEDQTLIFHNPTFIIWDNVLSSSFTYVTVYDKLTAERKKVEMTVEVSLSETLSMESWDVDIYIDENNPVRLRIPLPAVGIDILGYVYGHYYAYSDSVGMDNDGTLYLTDTVVSVGMNPYPSWYDEIASTTFLDMTLNFGKNNRVLYPAGDDPIFSIDLQENSSVYAYMGSDGNYSFSGDIQVRGGEIFYFQKYFYITSGSISFDDPNRFNPKINLRATLRDYSSSTEKVEIYLVLKDCTFDSLSPTLESSPVMELSEIMEILGQSILPSSTYGSVSVSSVASLVTEGYDILSRLGIVTSGNPLSSLSSSLKKVFGVDSFSLHSNILNNIVADTISQATNTLSTVYSPMARFLNGTTLNVGKYITRNLYMLLMVHLEATGDRTSYTIISDDLALDTEFSLEWANSAFNVTFFTRPSYFSFDSVLSTFGFSITKTVNF